MPPAAMKASEGSRRSCASDECLPHSPRGGESHQLTPVPSDKLIFIRVAPVFGASRRRTERTPSDVSILGRHYLHKWPGVRDRGGLGEDSCRRQGGPLCRCRVSSPLTDGWLIDWERPQKKTCEKWTDCICSTRPLWKDLAENISMLNETGGKPERYWAESSVSHYQTKNG